MPTPVLPVLDSTIPWLGFPGMALNITKSPMFETSVQETKTGRVATNAYMETPHWRFMFEIEVIRDQMGVARNVARSAPFNEFDTLCTFFLSRYGRSLPFFITDSQDYFVTNQLIMASTPSGRVAYPMLATFNPAGVDPFTQPVGGVNVLEDIEIRVNGTPTAAYTANEPYDGWITFDSAPSAASEIRADFSYYFKVAFEADQLDFKTHYIDLWDCKKLNLKTRRP